VSASTVNPVVVLGIGNALVADDGVGPFLIELLAARYRFPSDTVLVDGGTLGMRLLPTVSCARYLIVLDAYRSGLAPGAISVLPLEALMENRDTMVSLHQVDLFHALSMAELLGHRPPGVLFGVEPKDLTPGELGLSSAVRDALPTVIEQILGRLHEHGVQTVLSENSSHGDSRMMRRHGTVWILP
jgi:hydrogenase maturation protease